MYNSMDTSVFTDPVKLGPGIWFTMHVNAVQATSEALKQAFISNINSLCDNFKCLKCQKHFRNFIDTHPFSKYWHIKNNNGREIGFFKWTWELHNDVNKMLNKPQPSLEEAFEFYSNSKVGTCHSCAKPPITMVDKSHRIPPILTRYRESGEIKPVPFKHNK